MNKYTKIEIKSLIENYIKKDEILSNEIVSVYAMGSFAKKEKYNDIDLNFFCRKNYGNLISAIEKMISKFKEIYGIDIDPNIIDEDMYSKGLMNTKLFVHKYRASLLLFELKTLNSLVYGENILDEVIINENDLKEETKKLMLILRHRMSKDYLTKKRNFVNSKYLRKNVKYAIEFFLVNQGCHNPYFITSDELIKKYPILRKFDNIVKLALSDMEGTLNFKESYDFVIFLSDRVINEKI